MDRQRAEAVALQAVAFVIGDDTLRQRFLTVSGCPPEELRQRVQDPAVLVGVLEVLAANEPDLLRFADAARLPPPALRQALGALGNDWET